MGIELVENGEPMSWDDFEANARRDIKNTEKAKTLSQILHSQWIYRGQSNAEWPLMTTLERYLESHMKTNGDKFDAQQYYRYLAGIVPAINSLTSFKFKRFNPWQIELSSVEGLVPKYKLMCFARHHGFPTPILDWTASYFVAAYFAYADASGENVAIYAYKDQSGEGRSWGATEPYVSEQGSYVDAHERHFTQQSRYTICREKLDDRIVFSNQESAPSDGSGRHQIKKFILKAEDKDKVLKKLFYMNINSYSLFRSTESLMKMLAYKEFRNL